MNRTTLLAAALAALVVVTGAAAAVPGSTVAADDGRSNADDASETSGDAAEGVGPASGLPGPVPSFVSELHGLIDQFVDGTIDTLGPTVSGIAGGSGDDAEAEPFPTETPDDGETSSDGTTSDDDSTADTTTEATATTSPFGFAIDNVEECGQTCRDVTSTLTNQQDTTAENVTVHTRIFVDQGTDGDVIWRGEESVGTLSPGESYTATERVALSLADGLAVQNNDGWITVQTTVETAGRTVTFTDERQVA